MCTIVLSVPCNGVTRNIFMNESNAPFVYTSMRIVVLSAYNNNKLRLQNGTNNYFIADGTICEIRRGFGDWRVSDQKFDGHVTQYSLQSLSIGAIARKFRHEVTKKNSSTYQKINDFLEVIASGFDEDIFKDNFNSNVNDLIHESGLEHINIQQGTS